MEMDSGLDRSVTRRLLLGRLLPGIRVGRRWSGRLHHRVVASSVSLAPPQAAGLTHSAAPPFPMRPASLGSHGVLGIAHEVSRHILLLLFQYLHFLKKEQNEKRRCPFFKGNGLNYNKFSIFSRTVFRCFGRTSYPQILIPWHWRAPPAHPDPEQSVRFDLLRIPSISAAHP